MLCRCSFCPSLKVLSRLLGLSESVAGVTLVAFGNAAPDLFTSVAGLHGDARHFYTDLYGSAMCVLFLVTGLILSMAPVNVQPASFTINILFLLLNLIYIDYIIRRGKPVTIYDGACKSLNKSRFKHKPLITAFYSDYHYLHYVHSHRIC